MAGMRFLRTKDGVDQVSMFGECRTPYEQGLSWCPRCNLQSKETRIRIRWHCSSQPGMRFAASERQYGECNATIHGQFAARQSSRQPVLEHRFRGALPAKF